jgi:hypothetical protein
MKEGKGGHSEREMVEGVHSLLVMLFTEYYDTVPHHASLHMVTINGII